MGLRVKGLIIKRLTRGDRKPQACGTVGGRKAGGRRRFGAAAISGAGGAAGGPGKKRQQAAQAASAGPGDAGDAGRAAVLPAVKH